MRPEAAAAAADRDQIGLRVIPHRRMHRTLWRSIAVIVVVQAVVAVLALVLLQGRWGSSSGHGATLARTTAAQLSRHSISEHSAAAQAVLDRVVDDDAVGYAMILDGRGKIVLRNRLRSNASIDDALAVEVPLAASLGGDLRLRLGVRDLESRRALVQGAIAVTAGLLVAGLVLVPLVYRRIRAWSGGLRALHLAIRRLTLDQPLKPLPVGGADEVAYLALAFNDMAGRLLASRRALLEANAELERRVADRTAQLRTANIELDRKNTALAELTDTALRFTDDVAHEFRTPLAVIKEFASILSDGIGGDVTAQQVEYLRFIADASADLSRLVDDFLDSSKIRAHTLRVDRRSSDVAAILDSAWPMLLARASSASVALERQVEAELPPVYADVEKVRRALVNLTVNAIKFSDEQDTVTIGARLSEGDTVEIYVTDQGPGLSEEEVATLFERFKQAGEGRRSSAKGFGLGLNIVHELVAVNLGTVTVKSTLGAGSTFGFTLPAAGVESIIDCYLARVEERSAAPSLSLLRVDRESAAFNLDELQAFLASTVYPTDLALRDGDRRSLYLVGETVEAERWRQRLLECDRSERESRRGDGVAPLRITHIGTWPAAEAREHLLSASRSAGPDGSNVPTSSGKEYEDGKTQSTDCRRQPAVRPGALGSLEGARL